MLWLISILFVVAVADCGGTEHHWPPDDSSTNLSYGNHRVRIHVQNDPPAESDNGHFNIKAEISLSTGRIVGRSVGAIVTDDKGGVISNVRSLKNDGIHLHLMFEGSSSSSSYLVYYLPYIFHGEKTSLFFRVDYLNDSYTESRASSQWINKLQDDRAAVVDGVVEGRESRSEFEEFSEMEVPASHRQKQNIIDLCGHALGLVFPEDRRKQVRMKNEIPERWALDSKHSFGVSGGVNCQQAHFKGEAKRDEFYVFQLAVWALNDDIFIDSSSLAISSDFTLNSAGGGIQSVPSLSESSVNSVNENPVLPSSTFHIINTQGINNHGRPFSHLPIVVHKHRVQSLYIGGHIPANLTQGTFTGKLELKLSSSESAKIQVTLQVQGTAAEHGDYDLEGLSRLRWLDSTMGHEQIVTKPYAAVQVKENFDNQPDVIGVELKNKRLIIGRDCGIISSIKIKGFGEILAKPVFLEMIGGDGGDRVQWSCDKPKVVSKNDALVVIEQKARSSGDSNNGGVVVERMVELLVYFDGYIDVNVSLSSSSSFDAADVKLKIAMTAKASEYFMGLTHNGGLRPKNKKITWKWTERVGSGSNMLWVGGVKSGLRLHPKGRDGDWESPLHIITLDEDISWGGGVIQLMEEADEDKGEVVVVMESTTGPVYIEEEPLSLYCDLLITPLKPVDSQRHFSRRYYQHGYNGIASPKESSDLGANVFNVHQGVPSNPYINFPFASEAEEALTRTRLEADDHHFVGMNIYYTMRELSVRAADLFALRSMVADEIFAVGFGGGGPWLQEHLVGENYSVAWTSLLNDGSYDFAIHTKGNSRYVNYYVAGLDWLMSHSPKIDGIYVDEASMDRGSMLRIRRILEKHNENPDLDFHSCNKLTCPHNNLGFIVQSSSALIYMTHFSYIDRLWFGEGFSYITASKEEWLIEMSGIPFGLMADALHLPPQATFKALAHGMVNRPQPYIWNLLSLISAQDTQFIGWWDVNPLVKTSHSDVVASAFLGANNRDDNDSTTMIVIASFSQIDLDVKVSIDWRRLSPKTVKAFAYAPSIIGLQQEISQVNLDKVSVSRGYGLVLFI